MHFLPSTLPLGKWLKWWNNSFFHYLRCISQFIPFPVRAACSNTVSPSWCFQGSKQQGVQMQRSQIWSTVWQRKSIPRKWWNRNNLCCLHMLLPTEFLSPCFLFKCMNRRDWKMSLETILQGKWCFETTPSRVEIPENTREPCPWMITFMVCHGELHETIHTKTSTEATRTLHHVKSLHLLLSFLLLSPCFRMHRCISSLFSTLLFFSLKELGLPTWSIRKEDRQFNSPKSAAQSVGLASTRCRSRRAIYEPAGSKPKPQTLHT